MPSVFSGDLQTIGLQQDSHGWFSILWHLDILGLIGTVRNTSKSLCSSKYCKYCNSSSIFQHGFMGAWEAARTWLDCTWPRFPMDFHGFSVWIILDCWEQVMFPKPIKSSNHSFGATEKSLARSPRKAVVRYGPAEGEKRPISGRNSGENNHCFSRTIRRGQGVSFRLAALHGCFPLAHCIG